MRLQKVFVFVSIVFFSLSISCSSDPERTFYVDGIGGSDSNSGLSGENAWRSLEKVNSHLFSAGDRILFKRGSHFQGRLKPQGSGSEGQPIIIDAYGTGEKPVIAADGQFHEALLLENQEYWEISNLELTNLGPTREEFRYGVRLRAWDYGTVRHIHLKGLFVHDVNGSLVKKDSGEGHGITWENGGDQIRSRFDGLLIEDCHLLRTDRNGICGFTPYPYGTDWFPNLNVVVRNNKLEDIGGDGIKPWGCDGALIEGNVIDKGRQRCQDYAAGIWPWACDNTLIQFNEVSGMKGQKDGQAFDSDGFCKNTTFQYNYSHDNDGGFMLICGRENFNTVIRYNISQNDRTRLFHFYDLINDTWIYNNVFFVNEGTDVQLFLWTPGGSGWATDTRVLNNIFYILGTGRNSYGLRKKEIDDGVWLSEEGFGGAINVVFEKNILFGNFDGIPEEWRELTLDPMLLDPGSAGFGFDTLDGYRLRMDSPAIGAGVHVDNNGGRDFWGNPIPAGFPSIGVHEPE
jgi:hypothetical protein